MAEGTRASITCFHLAVAYVPAWSDIMLHITGELTAFSPLIPLQPGRFSTQPTCHAYLYNPSLETRRRRRRRRRVKQLSSQHYCCCYAEAAAYLILVGGKYLRLLLHIITEMAAG